MRLQEIEQLSVPSFREIEQMPRVEVENWLAVLAPYYAERKYILDKFGHEQWQKIAIVPALNMRLKAV